GPKPCAGRAACRAACAIASSWGPPWSRQDSGRHTATGLVELHVAQLRHARVAAPLVAVCLRIGVVERFAADRAEPRAVRPAEDLVGQREHQRIVCPPPGVQVAVLDVGTAELLVVRGLVHLAGVDLDSGLRVLEAADAGPTQLTGEAKAKRVAAAG